MNNKNLKNLISKTPSRWREKARERVSQPWLTEYSSEIARRISALIDKNDMNQTKLAELAGVERQYISKVMQGKENLSLQTIWKLSKALNFELITFPPYEYSANKKGEEISTVDFNSQGESLQQTEAKVVPFPPEYVLYGMGEQPLELKVQNG